MPRFKPGVSGNPAGKPKGTVSASTKLRQAITDDLPEIVEVLRQQALMGDVGAARLLLERALPALRPEVQTTPVPMAGDSLAERTEAVLSATLAGELSPTAGAELVGVLAGGARVLEIAELAQRIELLERSLAVRKK